MSKKKRLYTVNAALASGVLYFVQGLSAAGRTAIDWVVIGLVSAAILWNVVQLTRRTYSSFGGRGAWHVQRTVPFWAAGLGAVVAGQGRVAEWGLWPGRNLVIVATADSVALFQKERL